MTKAKLALMLLVGGGLLAACNNGNDDSVQGFAIRETITSSCESNTPKEINDTNFSSNENAEPLDVNSLQPGCELPDG